MVNEFNPGAIKINVIHKNTLLLGRVFKVSGIVKNKTMLLPLHRILMEDMNKSVSCRHEYH